MVTDEALFERLYESDVKKDKEMNKIMLKNYPDFKETLENDLKFLKDNNLLHVNLLMMYFEYENTQKHEKEGAIQIIKTDTNEAKIINVDIPEKTNNKKEEENKEGNKKENKEEDKEEKKQEKKKMSDTSALELLKEELENDDIQIKVIKKKVKTI